MPTWSGRGLRKARDERIDRLANGSPGQSPQLVESLSSPRLQIPRTRPITRTQLTPNKANLSPNQDHQASIRDALGVLGLRHSTPVHDFSSFIQRSMTRTCWRTLALLARRLDEGVAASCCAMRGSSRLLFVLLFLFSLRG